MNKLAVRFSREVSKRPSLVKQLALNRPVGDLVVPKGAQFNPKRKSPMNRLLAGTQVDLFKHSSAGPDYILTCLKYAGASAYEDYLEKRAFQLPLSWFMSNKLTGIGALLGGLGIGGKQALKLRGLARDAAAAKKVRGISGQSAKLEAEAAKAGTKFKPSWEQRVAGRDTKFLDATKGKNWKENPLDMLKAYLPQVASGGAQGTAAGAALGKIGDTLMAMHKRKKTMDMAKKVAIPAAAGLGAYALLKD